MDALSLVPIQKDNLFLKLKLKLKLKTVFINLNRIHILNSVFILNLCCISNSNSNRSFFVVLEATFFLQSSNNYQCNYVSPQFCSLADIRHKNIVFFQLRTRCQMSKGNSCTASPHPTKSRVPSPDRIMEQPL